VYEPELYKDMWNWTVETYRPKNPGKRDNQIFGSNCKFALKQFFDRIYSVDEDTERAIEAMVYAEALVYFRAFSSKGSAGLVRERLERQTADERPESRLGRAHPRMPAGIRVYAPRRA
jgi:fructose-bisphosphate aldolase class II